MIGMDLVLCGSPILYDRRFHTRKSVFKFVLIAIKGALFG